MTDNASAGATPAAGGATPPQTPAPAAAPSPATDDTDALGDPGKRAIERMKAERDDAVKAHRALQTQLEELQSASQSEHERALTQAKRDGAAEVATRYQAAIRRSEVKSALTAAGVPATLVDLASRADAFASLKVNDEGDVQGLDEAVKAFKDSTPDLFASKPAPARPADFGGGPRGTPATGARDMNTLIRSAAGRG